MIFGYVGAVVAGFLLTAIPNWTGRLPVAGVPLAALAALWAAGRIAVFASALIGRTSAAAIDASFLIVFAALVAREVAAGQNWRNLKLPGSAAHPTRRVMACSTWMKTFGRSCSRPLTPMETC